MAISDLSNEILAQIIANFVDEWSETNGNYHQTLCRVLGVSRK